MIVVHAAGVRSVDLTWVGWGALARSIDKILTMEELKEKSPLSHRRMMLTSPKKKQKTKTKKKQQQQEKQQHQKKSEFAKFRNIR